MAANYQDNRSVSIAGPGDMEGLALTRLSATEQISRPFRFDLELRGVDGAGARAAADPDTILGQPVSIEVTTTAAEPPELPPGVRSAFEVLAFPGFTTGPKAEVSFDEPMANSSMLSLPSMTAPSRQSCEVTVLS